MKRNLDMEAFDSRWRSTLPPGCRTRQLNTILETLKKCFPNFAAVDLVELNKMAEWFEEEIYTSATSHPDYVHQVHLKILKMEIRFQTAASLGMQSQVQNQGQSQISLPNQSQARQQQLSQNVPNTIVSTGAQSSASLPPALPSMTNLTQTSTPNVAGQRIKMQSGIAQNFVGSSVRQGLPSNSFTNMPGMHQLPLFSSQQLQHQLWKQKLLGNVDSSVIQLHIPQQPQQQPQNLLQPTQMSTAVGRSDNMQSEIPQNSVTYVIHGSPSNIYPKAYAQHLFQQHNQQFFSHVAVDWQEEIYLKIQAMKEKYLPVLNDMHQKISTECLQLEHKNPVLNIAQCERLKLLNMLGSHIQFLNVPKDNIVPAMKDNVSVYEKQIISLLKSNRPRTPILAQPQIQQSGGDPLSTQPQQQQEQEQHQQQQQQQQQ